MPMNFDGWDYHGSLFRSPHRIRAGITLAQHREEMVRLPVAWDIAREDFFHLNGAFLTPDPDGLSAGQTVAKADFEDTRRLGTTTASFATTSA